MDWQPSETAPKDGTWILGINNRGNCAVIIWRENAPVRDGFDPVTREPKFRHVSGWIHPFSLGELSEFWNGACGSVLVAWCALPRGDEARKIVHQFERKATV